MSQRTRAHSPTKNCTEDGCNRPLLARGLCGSHYGAWHRRTNGRTSNRVVLTISCVGCGEQGTSSRPDGKYCSELCYHYDKWGPRSSQWPRPAKRVAKPKPPPFSADRECKWCGAAFTTTVRSQVYCSRVHKVKAIRNRRRGREYGSTSHYTWAEVMRLHLHTFNRRCAYCEQPIVGQPDPDHVVPLSRGGSNSITNILPSCRPCNSDKRDLLLNEWAADRARRGRAPVTTAWMDGDPRVVHLTDPFLISPAA